MRCHVCNVTLNWDAYSPAVVCEICRTYRSVDVPDETGAQVVSLGRKGRYHCPGCRTRLSEAGLDGLKVESCGDCSGVLIPGDIFSMFVRNRRTEFRDAALQPVVLVTEQRERDLFCPGCRRVMTIHPCYGPNYLIVNSCTGCGLVWLDCSEVPAAQVLEV